MRSWDDGAIVIEVHHMGYDKDHDGKLDKQEMKELKEALTAPGEELVLQSFQVYFYRACASQPYVQQKINNLLYFKN